MDQLQGIALLLLGMIVVHRLMALPQMRRLNRQLAALKKTGPVASVGLAKHWLGNRAYLLITDEEGHILGGYYTGGNTVFAAFVPDKNLTETHYGQILDDLHQKQKLKRVEQAKRMAAEYLEKGLTERAQTSAQSGEQPEALGS